MQIYGTSFHCRKTKGNFSFAQIASKDMLLQVIQKIAYPWCQAFLLLREPLSSHCTVRVEMVMQQSYFRCGYNIHSLLLSHAISSCLRKKILLMKKTLHIIELDVLNLTVLQWYIHERGNNSHQIWTVVANIQTAVASVLHRYYQVSPRLTSQSTVLINSIVTLNIVISDCTGCTFGLILFEKSLLFTKQNYCAAARNLFSP